MRPNKLINEKSPYLIQHAYNPVDWYPWGEEAFNKARAENKPIFLSVGYSTCYWCHVMEREVFENQDIAQMMNESFINIKVDREERPDIDRIYMSALQSMTGSGGWPMNLFLTPELKPFYGATYIPPKAKYGRNGIEDIINEINKLWKSRQEEVIDSSNKIFGFLVKKTNKKTNVIFDDDSIIELQNKTFQQADNSFDVENGGFGQGNKFPRPVLLDFLLKYYHRFNEIEALDIVTFTLKKMYKGGIFDHLGGGFHRYSVDTYWRVPHFEKMLYDQAQIAELYLDTYLITKKELFLNSAENTLNYVLRNLTDNEGGFYSAEDAESYISEDDTSEKQEGAYYLWEKNEINELLNPEETKIFNTYFGLEQSGNTILDPHNVFGNRNVLYISKEIEEIAKSINISFDEVNKIIEDSKLKLLEIREKRPKPHLDDKILTSWNGLMISAMSKAYKVTAEKKYLDSAIKCADFLLQKLFSREEKILFHRFRNNEVKYNGTLEDYAFLINGLINLYEASLNIKYLKCAIELNDITCEKFYDDEKSGFYDTEPDKKDVIINLKDSYDGAEPSGNSVQLINMLKIGLITQNGSLIEQAKISLEFFFDEVSRLPFATPVMINAYFYYVNSFQEFIISGIDNNISSNFIKEINNHYLPDKILLAGDSELSKISNFINNISKDDEKPAVYICENYKCNLPIFDIENLKKYLESKKENLKEINK